VADKRSEKRSLYGALVVAAKRTQDARERKLELEKSASGGRAVANV